MSPRAVSSAVEELMELVALYGDARAHLASAGPQESPRTAASRETIRRRRALRGALEEALSPTPAVPPPPAAPRPARAGGHPVADVRLVGADHLELAWPPDEGQQLTLRLSNTAAKELAEDLMHATAEDIVRRELVRDGHLDAAAGPPTPIGHIPEEAP